MIKSRPSRARELKQVVRLGAVCGSHVAPLAGA